MKASHDVLEYDEITIAAAPASPAYAAMRDFLSVHNHRNKGIKEPAKAPA
jgi:hypothetical protein